MNKPKMLMVFFIYLVLITFVVDNYQDYQITKSLTEAEIEALELNADGVLSLLETFAEMATFQVVGLDAWVNLLLFYPVTIGIFAIIIGYIRGV